MIGNFDNEPVEEHNAPQNIETQKQSRIRHRKDYSLHYPTGNIILSFHDDSAFLFRDVSGAFMGKITIPDLVQYVTKKDTLEPNIIKLIEMTICTKRETRNSLNNIFLNQKSPFLNDIEILVVLNRWFRRTDGSIKDMPDNEQHIVRKFICQLLEHSLKVIAIISRSLQQSDSSTELKKKLMRYSSEILFRLTTIVNTETLNCLEKYNKIKDTSDLLQTIEQKINEKLRSFDSSKELKKTDQPFAGGSCTRGSPSCVPYQ
jgi:hypothetical protein